MMPRGASKYNEEAQNPTTSPIVLVRLIDIPHRIDGTKQSLYLTDCEHDVDHFDEKGIPCTYISCGLTYSQVSVSSSNEIATCRIKLDNVDRHFSAIAQYYDLRKVKTHVLRAFRNTLEYPDGSVYLFIGHGRAPIIGEYSMEMEVKMDFSLYQKLPRRMFWPRDFPYLPASKDIRNPL